MITTGLVRQNHSGGTRHLALVGTTASGKSALALEVARALGDIEIVSVDSMQVYRGMDIGTAKPTPSEQACVPHHLLDLADPWENYSVARFQRAAAETLNSIEARGRRGLLVGGTGLYFQAVVDG
ncbi:MAG TPA: isopentenyl transferase family protein, partial [Acidimicrobiales bacterium]